MRILTYITTEDDAGRAARSVVPRRFQLGMHAFRRLKVEGGILCDGKPLRADTVLRAGQLLEVRMDNGGVQAAPTDSGLDGLPPSFIRYIDEDMIVVSKGTPLATLPCGWKPGAPIRSVCICPISVVPSAATISMAANYRS